MPQAEYFMGAVLSAKGDRAGAAGHLQKLSDPRTVRAQCGDRQDADRKTERSERCPSAGLPVPETLVVETGEVMLTTTGEAWVPGGRKALAAIARLKSVPAADDFFLEYCRAVSRETSRLNESPTPGYAAALQAYIGSVAELMDLGERREDRTVITLSLVDGEAQEKAQRILALLGWKVVHGERAVTIEPGDQAIDGPRQQIFQALGIDELAMQETLEAGRSFQFEILSEEASLAGGAAWGPLLRGFLVLRGGMAEAFISGSRASPGPTPG